jgi:hypothetical protein
MNARKRDILAKMKRDLNNLPQPSGYEAFENKIYNIEKNSLDCCQPAIPTSSLYWMQTAQEQEQERPMRATIDMTGDASKDYVLDRLNRIKWTKECEISKKFSAPYPKTRKEAKQWLAEGFLHFTDDSDENEAYYGGWEWGKDNTKERALAYDTLNKTYQDAKDTVAVLSDEQARLKALKDFESFSVN